MVTIMSWHPFGSQMKQRTTSEGKTNSNDLQLALIQFLLFIHVILLHQNKPAHNIEPG
jgi:hypothetical protein